jgi:hypothetical protein
VGVGYFDQIVGCIVEIFGGYYLVVGVLYDLDDVAVSVKDVVFLVVILIGDCLPPLTISDGLLGLVGILHLY